MNNEVFKIILDGNMTVLSRMSLYETIDNFIKSNDSMILIIRTSSNDIKTEKQKYYNVQYNFFRRKYKSNKITERQYKDVITKLKDIKNATETVEEFEFEFEKYKRTLTIRPSYNSNANKLYAI